MLNYYLLTVCSWTAHLGGKITKSAIAVPGKADFDVSTVNMDGSFSNNGGIKIKYNSIKRDIFFNSILLRKTYYMIKGYRINCIKISKIIFIGNIISMPSHNIKWRMILKILS